jgi:hypothetical protein
MTEAQLKEKQRLACKMEMPFGLFWKHQDKTNHGYPDVSFAWEMVCSWWEFKFWDNEPFTSPEQQHLTCQRLALQAICYYVIFEEYKSDRNTYIVEPRHLHAWKSTPKARFGGFDYTGVAQFMRRTHLLARPAQVNV